MQIPKPLQPYFGKRPTHSLLDGTLDGNVQPCLCRRLPKQSPSSTRRGEISTHGLTPLRRLIVCNPDNLLKEPIRESNSPCFDIALQVITSLREVPTPIFGVGLFGMLNRRCF